MKQVSMFSVNLDLVIILKAMMRDLISSKLFFPLINFNIRK